MPQGFRRSASHAPWHNQARPRFARAIATRFPGLSAKGVAEHLARPLCPLDRLAGPISRGVGFERHAPLLAMLLVTRFALLFLDHGKRALPEGFLGWLG